MQRAIGYCFCFFILSLLVGCARIVAPVGGPKDVAPPTVVKELPPNGSVYFSDRSFKISFDEFVVLDNTLENVLISPPMQDPPTYTLSGKTLTVKFVDTLRPNQTYNFVFTNCIKDFTEGNPIPIYNYAFSTGGYVDSFMLEGKVIDAQSAAPVASCFVFAYKYDVDSLPLTTRPDFVSKTQNDGSFSIKNVPAGEYKLFALKDVNNNMLFDLQNESIAFYEQLVNAVPIPKADTAHADSLGMKEKRKMGTDSVRCLLKMFVEADTTQTYMKMQNSEAGKYEFFYRNKITDVQARILSPNIEDYFQIVGKDTITWYWKTIPTDTVLVEMTVNGTRCDTLRLQPYKKKEGRGRGKKENKKLLQVTALNQGELHRPLTLQFSYPVRPVADFQACVVAKHRHSGNDTTWLTLSVPDTLVTTLPIALKLDEKVSYVITIRDSVFLGYNGLANDSLRFEFVAKTAKNYGALRMKYLIPDATFPYIVQLLNAKDEICAVHTLTATQEIFYSNLPEGNYKIKVIEDSNADGEWTTGNYREKQLPENIIRYPKSIFVRGNWEVEEEFDIATSGDPTSGMR